MTANTNLRTVSLAMRSGLARCSEWNHVASSAVGTGQALEGFGDVVEEAFAPPGLQVEGLEVSQHRAGGRVLVEQGIGWSCDRVH